MTPVVIFTVTFLGMEFAAWSLHKYIMHGPLWVLHEDHHDPRHVGLFQKNDAFAFFFFLPSFLSILIGSLTSNSSLSAFGYGIMAYGLAYFFVHEVIIHRRLKWFRSKGFYLNALVSAHKQHHAVQSKRGATNFGMLLIPPRYFSEAYRRRQQRRHKSSSL